ncbi:MAG: hypothetical protein HY606_06910 [Planctomycetes bacterium]|nr:hypothetical protein [Planctomycetota bacterium]
MASPWCSPSTPGLTTPGRLNCGPGFRWNCHRRVCRSIAHWTAPAVPWPGSSNITAFRRKQPPTSSQEALPAKKDGSPNGLKDRTFRAVFEMAINQLYNATRMVL